MNYDKNKVLTHWTKIFLILEIQIILLLVIIAMLKLNSLDTKVFNTNKFIHEVLVDKRIETLNILKDSDIMLGKMDAPVTLIVYSRFDCSACNDFFAGTYESLKTDFIDKGLVKLIVRYLVHPSKKNTLYATKCAYYVNQSAKYDQFVKQLCIDYPRLDTVSMKSWTIAMTKKPEAFQAFINDISTTKNLIRSAATIRASGIRETPVLFINNQWITGNPDYNELSRIILAEVENEISKEVK